MNNPTKGALAAGAAVVLLLGGAGSLAYWSDTADVPGGDIVTGSLSIDPDGPCTDWVYAAGNAAAGAPITKIVPGDSITKTCDFIVGAEGDNILAEATMPSTVTYTPSATAASLELSADASFKLDGSPFTSGGAVADGQTLTADIVVTFPFDNPTGTNVNDTQNLTVTLDALTVTLTQVEA
ncbi:alternate-type signal peptide domain-containing protein [Nocardioides sp.]|uniref:alternate-type signal peptide domain-containing protein n=1 Tax=Nocardioides sp. TaxID=35761 RepID=UPI003561CBDD